MMYKGKLKKPGLFSIYLQELLWTSHFLLRGTQNGKGQWSLTAAEDDPCEHKEKILPL